MTKPEWDEINTLVGFEGYGAKAGDKVIVNGVEYLSPEAVSTAIMAAKAEERASIIAELESLKADFLSPGYSVDQPSGSFTERFAVGECINTIRNRDTV